MNPQMRVWNDDCVSEQEGQVGLAELREQVFLDPCFRRRSSLFGVDLAVCVDPCVVQLGLQAGWRRQLVLVLVDLDELVQLHSVLGALLRKQNTHGD